MPAPASQHNNLTSGGLIQRNLNATNRLTVIVCWAEYSVDYYEYRCRSAVGTSRNISAMGTWVRVRCL